MPPVETTSMPPPSSEEGRKRSITDLKVVEKAMEIPAVSDTYNVLASAISENGTVKSAINWVDDSVKAIKDNKEFQDFKDTVENVKNNKTVNLVADAVAPKLSSAVEALDNVAAVGLDNLTSAVPSLNAPTKELMDNTKEAASDYLGNVKEYLASFQVGQLSLKLVDKSLSVAEKGANLLGGTAEASSQSFLSRTYQTVRRSRRAIRALRRAGMRRSALSCDSLAKAGMAGKLASMLSINTLLKMVGLELVKRSEAKKLIGSCTEEESQTREASESKDNRHTHISDIQGDLDGYRSDEDPDFEPDFSEESVDESTDSESDEEEEGEDEEEAEEVEEASPSRTKLWSKASPSKNS